jgi:hypothetical protein
MLAKPESNAGLNWRKEACFRIRRPAALRQHVRHALGPLRARVRWE